MKGLLRGDFFTYQTLNGVNSNMLDIWLVVVLGPVGDRSI